MGLDRRVGRDAVKAVEHLAVGKRGQIAHAGRVGRVPAERRVQCVEHAIASQKCLGGAVFLCRAAEIDHRARCTGRFQIGLDGKRRSERTDAEQVMPTAVTTEAAGGFLMRHARLLAQIHQCVEFAQNTDDRPAAAETPGKGGRDMPKSGLELKPFCSQDLLQLLCALKFLEAELRVIPDIVCCFYQQIFLFFNFSNNVKLQFIPFPFCAHPFIFLLLYQCLCRFYIADCFILIAKSVIIQGRVFHGFVLQYKCRKPTGKERLFPCRKTSHITL